MVNLFHKHVLEFHYATINGLVHPSCLNRCTLLTIQGDERSRFRKDGMGFFKLILSLAAPSYYSCGSTAGPPPHISALNTQWERSVQKRGNKIVCNSVNNTSTIQVGSSFSEGLHILRIARSPVIYSKFCWTLGPRCNAHDVCNLQYILYLTLHTYLT